ASRHHLESLFPHVPINPKSPFRQLLSEVFSQPEEFDDGQTVGHAWQTIRAAEERAGAQERQWVEMRSTSSGLSSSASERGGDGGVKSGGKEDDDVDDERVSEAEPVEGPAGHGNTEEPADEIHLVVDTTAGYLADM